MKIGDLVKTKNEYIHTLGGRMNSEIVSRFVGFQWGIVLNFYEGEKPTIDIYLNNGIMSEKAPVTKYEVISSA
jgi:hypothetical protein|tara:strand:- start:413 stop:631 length:219 start_codon:yes stop_codon:yes gene_type:complete